MRSAAWSAKSVYLLDRLDSLGVMDRPDVRRVLEAVGPPLEVPLKILTVQTARDWTRFLVEEHGLVRSQARLRETGFEFWHTLSVLRLTRS